MSITDAVIAQQALLQQSLGLAVLKQAADQQQQIAAILAQSTDTVPVSQLLGSSIDLSA